MIFLVFNIFHCNNITQSTVYNRYSPMYAMLHKVTRSGISFVEHYINPNLYQWLTNLSIAGIFHHHTVAYLIRIVVESLDVVESFQYFALRVSTNQTNGAISPSATRFEILLFYFYFLFFFWILVTPILGTVMGLLMWTSVAIFNTGVNLVYSALGIEDYKHFLRGQINCKTGDLTIFVVGVHRVPKGWQNNSSHIAEKKHYKQQLSTSMIPPYHWWHSPSLWIPKKINYLKDNLSRRYNGPILIDKFTVSPLNYVANE